MIRWIKKKKNLTEVNYSMTDYERTKIQKKNE